MAILKRDYTKRTIDLGGPDGNAFVLMGYATSLGKQLNKDTKAIVKEMQSGDYENLIEVFDREFGDYVDLVRAEEGEDDDY